MESSSLSMAAVTHTPEPLSAFFEDTIIASSPKCSLTLFKASVIDGAEKVFKRISKILA